MNSQRPWSGGKPNKRASAGKGKVGSNLPSVTVAFLTSQALIINDLALTHDNRILGHYDEIKIEAQKQGVRVWCWDTGGKSFSNTPSHSWNWLGGLDIHDFSAVEFCVKIILGRKK
ncbi:MAG: hypothetical protein ACFB14_21475 [Leptolyngbyaceae cyanobacterium]